MSEDPARESWVQRWREHRTGWHRDTTNRHLIEYGPRLFPESSTILVPLSGKSVDLVWLEEAGHPVIGLEYAREAVEAFHAENGRSAEVDGSIYRSGQITTYVDDVFTAKDPPAQSVDGVYDRAALVAIAPARREEYAERLTRWLCPGGSILLVTVDYPQEETEGPPFSVPDATVESLFRDGYDITRLEHQAILEQQPKWQERGVSRLSESVFELKRRDS
ncbi:MAG: thiopurine S-methyltransferase [Planctomycetota bacterium]